MDRHGDIGRTRATPRIEGPPPYLAALEQSPSTQSFYDNRGSWDPAFQTLSEAVATKRIALISIDVFDTTLLRDQCAEAERFQRASERFVQTVGPTGAGPHFSSGDALAARIIAAKAAYRMQHDGARNVDPGFTRIAATVCHLLGRPDLLSDYIENEIAAEIANTRLNPLIARVIERFEDIPTVFLSDMYLEGHRIRDILAAKIGGYSTPTVFSSADGVGSKASGALFKHVEQIFGVPPDQTLHIGDDLETDYLGAKRAGWQGFHLPLPVPEVEARRASHDRAWNGPVAAGLANDIAFTP